MVGDVIGKYHPHGNEAVYMSLVRMAQEFSLRVTLVDGQGNFGSIDGDMPAAMRYTEVRMEKITNSLLDDLENDTVDMKDTYDSSNQEPTVLPARFPNLLVNGGSGIAVGMATNIPSHNLGETIDATLPCSTIRNITVTEIMQYLPGPDFPTAGIILGRAGIRSAYETGRGSILIRGKSNVEEMRGNREAIIITEIPYQVNKATMIEKMAELVREKRIEGISDIRDESDRHGIRVVIELKRDAVPDVVLNQLYRFTPLQSSFGCNFVALNGGKPELMNIRDMLAGLHRVPRGGRDAPHEVPAQQGARPRPCAGRPRRRRRQYRRSHRHSSARRPIRRRRASSLMDARLAGAGRRAADRADRRSAPQDRRGRHVQSLRRAGARHPRADASAA